MTSVGWATAALLSLPMFVVFHTNYVTEPGPFQNLTVCESIWRFRPLYERQIFLTYVAVFVFYVPIIIIILCYVRIFLKIAEKANESQSNKKQPCKPGKVHLQSTPSSSLPKAKIKTLKMTVVIVLTFILCSLPYHVMEMIYSYGDHTIISPVVASIIGGMGVANSAVNPYVFLLFNVNAKCLKGVSSIFPWSRERNRFESTMSTASTRSEYITNRTDYTSLHHHHHRDDVHARAGGAAKYQVAGIDTVELSLKSSKPCGARGGNYVLVRNCERDDRIKNVKI